MANKHVKCVCMIFLNIFYFQNMFQCIFRTFFGKLFGFKHVTFLCIFFDNWKEVKFLFLCFLWNNLYFFLLALISLISLHLRKHLKIVHFLEFLYKSITEPVHSIQLLIVALPNFSIARSRSLWSCTLVH